MAYPNSLDSFTNPLATDKLSSPSHSGIETAQNNSISQIEMYLGTVSSTATTSITYAVKSTSSIDPGHKHSAASILSVPASAVTSVNASALFGTFPSSGVSFPASAIPGSAVFGNISSTTVTLPATSIVYSASSVPASSVVGTLPAGVLKFSSGTTTKNAADSSTVQNILHGLGVIPKQVTINFSGQDQDSITATAIEFARTVYNGSVQSSQSFYRNTGGGAGVFTLDNSFTLNSSNNNPATQIGVVTFDATNIIITWTKTGTPTGTFPGLWTATA